MSADVAKDFYMVIGADAPKLWSMSLAERLRRQMQKLGVSDAVQNGGNALILRGDVVYDLAVLKELAARPGTVLQEGGQVFAACVPAANSQAAHDALAGGAAPAGLTPATPTQIAGSYNHELRKSEPPICAVLSAGNIDDIEWRLFKASYKGVTDLVTKFVWPVPAFYATRLCAKLGLSPNMVTSIGAVLMLFALWAFAQGFYGIGLLAGWVMTFLDTVDGKLARVTITSSKWGNIFDHGLDLLHPPFWYIAWGFGLAAFGTPLAAGWLAPLLWAMFAFYVLGRLVEGYFMRRFHMHIHVWRPWDSAFRLVLARRNPNMIALTLCWILGRPDIGLIIITAWTVATFFVHIWQTILAERDRAAGRAVVSWLSQPAAAAQT